MRKVIGVGETILDIIFKNDQPHAAVPGGSVFNGLVSLGRLGVSVSFISEIGKDKVGDIIVSFMQENNLSTDYIDRFPDGKSPVSLAFLDEQQNATYLFYKDYPKQRLDVTFPQINEDDILIFGSYYSLSPVLRQRIAELLEYAHERKALIYYDPNFRNAHADESIRLLPAVLENFEYADIIRGSDEDFHNLFDKTEAEEIYNQHIKFYCNRFILTQGAGGVQLFAGSIRASFHVPAITPLSTIGAGDNFNAGVVFGLLKYKIGRKDLDSLKEEEWAKIIACGIEFASNVCTSYANYISADFANQCLANTK